MYYTIQCSACTKWFCWYGHDRYRAAEALYYAIRAHLEEYGEDDNEHQYDDEPYKDIKEVLYDMEEYEEKPAGVIMI